MDFIFKTDIFLSNLSIDKIYVKIKFKNCSDYDIDSLNFLKSEVFHCDYSSLPDNIYTKLTNKNFITIIDVENDRYGFIKEYKPENISVIVDKESNPKGIMINDTAEIYNINEIPPDIKDKLSLLLGFNNISNSPPPSNVEAQSPVSETPDSNISPITSPIKIPDPVKDATDRSSLRMCPQFNEIFDTTLKQMDNIKPSEDLLNDMGHVGDDMWVNIKNKLSILGGGDASST